MTDASKSMAHPAQESYGVNASKLTAGDVLTRACQDYRVTEGFKDEPSSCWRQSGLVRCVQIGGTFFAGAIRFVDPVGATVRSADANCCA